jgi:hypothetical protein
MGALSPKTLAWAAVGAMMIAYCAGLAAWSAAFGYAVAVADMPVVPLVGLGVLAGGAFLLIVPLVRHHRDAAGHGALMAWILLAGLAMRLVFLGSEPILEDDYQRYLWDGAVTAHGLDPYAHAPALATVPGLLPEAFVRLADEAGAVLARINYPQLRTVYPPVAQAAFALAHWLGPWSLDAWRIVLIVCDMAVAGLVIMLLRSLGRPLPWLALYWWNPLVAKELANSAHMDVVVMVPVLAAVVLAVRSRPLGAALALAIGFGAKLWPVILLPTVLRSRGIAPQRIVVAALAAAVLCALLAWPVVRATLDAGSGFLAYGGGWQANDALFRVIEWIVVAAAAPFGADAETGGVAARLLAAAMLAAFVVWINVTPAASPRELCRRAFLTIAALLLLSPTQFPWYFCWLAPFLPLFPVPGFLLLTATLPLYYLTFHLASRGLDAWFENGVVFGIWLPVWALLVYEAIRNGSIAAAPARDLEATHE